VNPTSQSNIDVLLAMLRNERHWVRAKAIHFVEQQFSSSVGRGIIQEIHSGLNNTDKELPEDIKGLSVVLEDLLSEPQRDSLGR
jgi:hypothetical protein